MRRFLELVRPSPAMVVASIALLFALAGGAFAAGTIVSNSNRVDGFHASAKAKAGMLLPLDTGATGAQGAKGDTGATGNGISDVSVDTTFCAYGGWTISFFEVFSPVTVSNGSDRADRSGLRAVVGHHHERRPGRLQRFGRVQLPGCDTGGSFTTGHVYCAIGQNPGGVGGPLELGEPHAPRQLHPDQPVRRRQLRGNGNPHREGARAGRRPADRSIGLHRRHARLPRHGDGRAVASRLID